jgi:hypothetical protein
MYVMLLFLLKANSMSKLYLKRTFGYWLSCLFEIAFVATRPFRKLAHLPLSCHSSSTRKSSSGKKEVFHFGSQSASQSGCDRHSNRKSRLESTFFRETAAPTTAGLNDCHERRGRWQLLRSGKARARFLKQNSVPEVAKPYLSYLA